MRRTVCIPLIAMTLLLAGCTTAYYKTMQTLGKEKRDILVQRIKDAKKDQDQTKQQLQTTMESFQALTGFQGGSLEKSYKRLNSDYESANSQAGKLHDKIQSIDQVSNDLFKEWQGEIAAMGNAKLKAQDTVMLRNAKTRQATYMRAMRRTEDQIAPVLKAFRDQVLFLKHNLNSRAIGSLKGTTAGLQGDVAGLIQSIDASSQEADKLISSLAASDNPVSYTHLDVYKRQTFRRTVLLVNCCAPGRSATRYAIRSEAPFSPHCRRVRTWLRRFLRRYRVMSPSRMPSSETPVTGASWSFSTARLASPRSR